MNSFSTPIFYYCFLLILWSGVACSVQQQPSNYTATNKAYPHLINTQSPTPDPCAAQYSPTCRVLQLQGKQLYACLKFQPKALVYTWNLEEDPSSPSLDKVQLHCDQQGVRLYVIAASYNGAIMQQEYALDYPIIGLPTSVNHQDFLKELGVLLEKKATAQFHYFENGHYHGAYKTLSSI